jgi:GNAT superfamily N-acetyltransferase
MIFIDQAFASKFEAHCIHFRHLMAAVRKKLVPDCIEEHLEIAGGTAFYDGETAKAYGLGLGCEVEKEEVGLLEAFLQQSSKGQIYVTPFTHASLTEELGRRKWGIADWSSVLFLDLNTEREIDYHAEHIVIKGSQEEELDEWSEITARGFSETAKVTDDEVNLQRTYGLTTGMQRYFAFFRNQCAGAASYIRIQDMGIIFIASTLPEFRRRGIHRALILKRLEDAKQQGCRIAVFACKPGSISHRNAERCGFTLAFSRSLLTKRWGESRG